jgi:hypothetical protein
MSETVLQRSLRLLRSLFKAYIRQPELVSSPVEVLRRPILKRYGGLCLITGAERLILGIPSELSGAEFAGRLCRRKTLAPVMNLPFS